MRGKGRILEGEDLVRGLLVGSVLLKICNFAKNIAEICRFWGIFGHFDSLA